MKSLTHLIFVVLILGPAVSYGNWIDFKELSTEEIAPQLQEMAFSDLDILVRQVLFDVKKNGINDPMKGQMIQREHFRRIKADPGKYIFLFSEESGDKMGPEYQQHLFQVFGFSTAAMSEATIAEVLLIAQQVIVDRSEDEIVRIAALNVGDEIIQAAEEASTISVNIIDDFIKVYWNILSDDAEATIVRVNALRGIRSLGLRPYAPQLLDLFISGAANTAPLDRSIISTLGEWQYLELLPVGASLLRSTSDQKLRNSTAYAMGCLGVFETIGPLVECIDRKQDLDFSCRIALHKNAQLIFSALKSDDKDRVILALRACQFVRGNPEGLISSLSILLDNDDPNIVLSAAKRLARTKDAGAVSNLVQNLRGVPGSELEDYLKTLRKMQRVKRHKIPSAVEPEGGAKNRESRGAKDEEPAYEVGDAVYQDFGSGVVYRHAALFMGYAKNNQMECEIVQSSLFGGGVHISPFEDMWDDSDLVFYGAYGNSTLGFTERQNIIATGRQLVDSAIGYVNPVYLNALDYSSSLPEETSISIEYIEGLRCDGTVEYCYEVNGNPVWDQDTTDGAHFDISHNKEWADEHNDTPEVTIQCDSEFSPLAQMGGCENSNTTFLPLGEGTQPEVEFWETEINGELFIYASDEQS